MIDSILRNRSKKNDKWFRLGKNKNILMAQFLVCFFFVQINGLRD